MKITLDHGSGGKEMQDLIGKFSENFYKGDWENTDNDSATKKVDNQSIVFTSDSYVVTPLFFNGGNIGKLAFCGTVNDLVVMGAKPIGLSLSYIIEEGFPRSDLDKITKTIADLSNQTKIPIVTGDTKVMEKSSVDKLIINTAGVGLAENILNQNPIPGDSVIVSGSIGDHAATLLAKRFDMEIDLETDCKPLNEEMNKISDKIKLAKDITRGGIAAALNEISDKLRVGIEISEEIIPLKQEVKSLTKVLGIEPYNLACEGRLVCITDKPEEVLAELTKFNQEATIIGKITGEDHVTIQTRFGKKLLSMPSGIIVPRIC